MSSNLRIWAIKKKLHETQIFFEFFFKVCNFLEKKCNRGCWHFICLSSKFCLVQLILKPKDYHSFYKKQIYRNIMTIIKSTPGIHLINKLKQIKTIKLHLQNANIKQQLQIQNDATFLIAQHLFECNTSPKKWSPLIHVVRESQWR